MHFTWDQKKVVVTGGAGFVGSHVVGELLRLGANVTVIDNEITGTRANLRFEGLEKEVVEQNLQFMFGRADREPSKLLPPNWIPDIVFHLASPASPPQYQKYPIETYLVNSYGTHLWLYYLHQQAPDARFVFASTSEVYGDPEVHPQHEGYFGNVNPNGPRSCYDEAKRLGESICGVFQREFGLDTRIVRIFNTYGPRMNPLDGRVIPNFVTQALLNQPITLFGDGSQTRSYCFVDDLVRGLLLLAEKDVSGQTINIGNPVELTVLQTAEIIKKMVGSQSEIIVHSAPLPENDPQKRRPDITKAHQLLGWQPTTTFEQGLKKTIEFFRSITPPNILE